MGFIVVRKIQNIFALLKYVLLYSHHEKRTFETPFYDRCYHRHLTPLKYIAYPHSNIPLEARHLTKNTAITHL